MIAKLVDQLVSPIPAKAPLDLRAIGTRLLHSVLNWIASCFALPLPELRSPRADDLGEAATNHDVNTLVDETTDWDEELKKCLYAEDADGSESIALPRLY
ncbi:hypothetical protein GY45DRAFT_1375032 [Cubamyces sp. BRFM 1775]|nr:hypothetical protein GY45DRAFT_1375032 [Cubamyces sp. BRFM 1775]